MGKILWCILYVNALLSKQLQVGRFLVFPTYFKQKKRIKTFLEELDWTQVLLQATTLTISSLGNFSEQRFSLATAVWGSLWILLCNLLKIVAILFGNLHLLFQKIIRFDELPSCAPTFDALWVWSNI